MATWISLLRAGVPTEIFVPRRVWDNALRVVTGVETVRSLHDRTKVARDYGLVQILSHRGADKTSWVKLKPPGAEGQFLPVEEDVDELATPQRPASKEVRVRP